MPATKPLSPVDRLCLLLVTAGGLGLIPVAPGTFGSLAGVAAYAVALQAGPTEPLQSLLLVAGIVAASTATVALGGWAENFFGKKDAGAFVLDEVAGFLLTVLIARPSAGSPQWWWETAIAFAVWRLFDVVKLPPARQLERLPRGWGVLADDLASAVFAGLALAALRWLAG